jgi:hypothetical protein
MMMMMMMMIVTLSGFLIAVRPAYGALESFKNKNKIYQQYK